MDDAGYGSNRFWGSTWGRVSIVLLLAAAVRIAYLCLGGINLGPDSTQYLSMAANLADRHELRSAGAMFPDIMRPVLYPIAVSFFCPLLGSAEAAGVFVSLLSGTLSALVIYLLAVELFDSTTGFIAAAIVPFHPTLVKISLSCSTDALALCLLLSAYLFGVKALRGGGYGSVLLSGAFFALAFLARQIAEVHFYFFAPFYVLVNLARRRYSFALRGGVLLAGAAAVVLTPYLWFTHERVGRVVLNTGKAYVSVKREVLRHKTEDGLYERLLAASPEGEALAAALREDITYFALNDRSDGLLSFEYYRDNLLNPRTEVAARTVLDRVTSRAAAAKLYDFLRYFTLSYSFLAPFLAAGAYACLRRKDYFVLLFLLCATCADPLVFGDFEYRYGVYAFSLFGILIAYGVRSSIDWAPLRRTYARRACAVGLLLLSSVPASLRYQWRDLSEIRARRAEAKAVARSLGEHVPPGSAMAMRHPEVAFYLGARYVPLPIAEYGDTLRYLRETGVDFVLMSPRAFQLRPFLPPSELAESPDLAAAATIPGGWRLYRVGPGAANAGGGR